MIRKLPLDPKLGIGANPRLQQLFVDAAIVTRDLQTQVDTKAPVDAPTFTGAVGVGTAAPAWDTNVGKVIGLDTIGGAHVRGDAAYGVAELGGNAYYASGWKYQAASLGAGCFYYSGSLNSFNWMLAPTNAGAAGAAATMTVKMTLEESGAVTFRPPASVTPSVNGDLTFEITSNTQLTFKLKGSDGTVRAGTITLS